MKIAMLAAAMSGAALTACAPLGAPSSAPQSAVATRETPLPPGACFNTTDIRSHTIGDSRTLYIRDRRERVYRATMGHDCFAASLPFDPIVTRTFGVTQVCRPLDLNVSLPGRSRCIAESLTLLTPAEVEALPERIRPG